MSTKSTCPLCDFSPVVKKAAKFQAAEEFGCTQCGTFGIQTLVEDRIRSMSQDDRMKIAVRIFEIDLHSSEEGTNPLFIGDNQNQETPGYRKILLDDLLSGFPKEVSDRIDRTLLNLAAMSPTPGHELEIGLTERAFLGENTQAARFILNQLKADGMVRHSNQKVSLLTKGWIRVSELQREKGRKSGSQAFVAMSFLEDQKHQEIRKGIQDGIKASGYEPFFVDRAQYNGKICDVIIGEIRRSRFLVAEFSGQRQNVYYEAGFAKGLGIPVIYCCEEPEINNAHFDTRQYNHIVWKNALDLSTKLSNRIRATIH